MADSPHATPPAEFRAWTASEKLAWTRRELLEASVYSPTTRPDLQMGGPLQMLRVAGRRRTLSRTLERRADTMEPDRPKIIHTCGAVGSVELVMAPSSTYTGVLAPPPTGGAIGVMRLSLAVPPSGRRSVTPGLGLKLFVDGDDSLDLLAMNHTVGQGRDTNLFSNTFTHDLRSEHAELRPPQKIMGFFFKRVVAEPRWLSIDHLSAVDRRGAMVRSPRTPDRLVFRPHPDVRTVFRGAALVDFRDTLARIESGAGLYSVEAVSAGGEVETIGTLRLIEPFVSSIGGDRLFFRHHVAPENLVG